MSRSRRVLVAALAAAAALLIGSVAIASQMGSPSEQLDEIDQHLATAAAALSEAQRTADELRSTLDATTSTTEPTNPPATTVEDGWPVVTGATASGVPGGVSLAWDAVEGDHTGVQITAGDGDGYIGRVAAPAGATSWQWMQLDPGEYTFDLGVIVAGENPPRDALSRVTATVPDPPSGDGGGSDPSGEEPASPLGYAPVWNPQDPLAWASELERWVTARAGARGELAPVSSQAQLDAAGVDPACDAIWSDSWRGLVVRGGCVLEGVDVAGLIVLNSSAGRDVVLRNVRAQGCWGNYGSPGGGGRVARAEQVTMVRNPTLSLGRGALNCMAAGFEIVRADLSGFADGAQVSGGGRIVETWVHDLAYGASTHNDFVQNYSGHVHIERSVMTGAPPRDNLQNGVFSSNNAGASYRVVDSVLRTTGPHRAKNWTTHANTSTITVERSLHEGIAIADVRFSDTWVIPTSGVDEMVYHPPAS